MKESLYKIYNAIALDNGISVSRINECQKPDTVLNENYFEQANFSEPTSNNKNHMDEYSLISNKAEKSQYARRNGNLGLDLSSLNQASFQVHNVPPEYADDPDLYYALQASLNNPDDDVMQQDQDW